MSSPISMFHDADGSGDWSMTRVTVFMTAVSLNIGIVVMAWTKQLGTIGLPLAAVIIVTELAVPIYGLFRMLTEWLKTRPGAAMLNQVAKKIGDKVGIAIPDLAAPTTATINVNAAPVEEG